MREFPEPDWKVFREVRTAALERFCARVLADVQRIAADGSLSAHDRYLQVYRLVERKDLELAGAFDNPRRSQAIAQLARMQALDLLTPEELSRFTPATRDSILALMPIARQTQRARSRW